MKTPEEKAIDHAWELLPKNTPRDTLLTAQQMTRYQSYRDGYSEAVRDLAPRKIDPKDESTWPSGGDRFVLYHKDGSAFVDGWGYDGSNEMEVDMHNGEYVAWAPILKLPKGEE